MRGLKKRLAVGIFVLGLGAVTALPAFADDHLNTAADAGGLTRGVSQPFLNGVNNPGIRGGAVPGTGSPHSGADHVVPSVSLADLPGNGTPGGPNGQQPLPEAAQHPVPNN